MIPPSQFASLGEDETEEGGGSSDTRSEKVQKQLKSHLNGLYNGLSKIMMTTCNLSQQGEEEEDEGENKAPFSVEKAIHNIMFIKHHMKRQDEFDAVREDNKSQIAASVSTPYLLFVYIL